MNHSTLEMLLEVSAPWSVVSAEFDPQRRQLEVHVAVAKTSWFGAVRPLRPEGARSFEWRHLALSGRRLLIRLDCPADMRVPEAPWAGAEDSPFSHALSQRLVMMFDSGATLPVVSAVLDLEPQEVWRFRRRLDTGKLGAGWQPPEVPAVRAASSISAASISPESVVPEPRVAGPAADEMPVSVRAAEQQPVASPPSPPPQIADRSVAAPVIVAPDTPAPMIAAAATPVQWQVDPLIESFLFDLPSPPVRKPAVTRAPAVLELPEFDYAAWEAERKPEETKRKSFA